MLRTEFVIQTVLKSLETLCRENDLSPHNEAINKTLSNLVQTLAATYEKLEEDQILADERVRKARPKLLEKLSHAEAQMEKYWADQFIEKENLTAEDLKSFWYWSNYDKLVDRELACMPSIKGQENPEIAFIGAGALPLTAIIMHQKTGIPVTCIDNDPEACRKAEILLEKLGLTEMRVICASGEELNYNRYDAVMLASLIPQAQKDNILDEILNSKTDSYILIRSAERLHTLLYEPVDETKLAENCLFLDKTDQDAEVINTTLVYHGKSGRLSLQKYQEAEKGQNAILQALAPGR